MIRTLADDDTRHSNAMRVTRTAMFFISAAVKYLAELQGQIANRTATREQVNRLVRLGAHNLAEAVQRLTAQHGSARKDRYQGLPYGRLAYAGGVSRPVQALHPL